VITQSRGGSRDVPPLLSSGVFCCVRNFFFRILQSFLSVKHPCQGKQSISYVVVFICSFAYRLYLLFCPYEFLCVAL